MVLVWLILAHLALDKAAVARHVAVHRAYWSAGTVGDVIVVSFLLDVDIFVVN